MTGLYIHVPICVARCRYCDFYKMTPGEWQDVELFLRSLDTELSRLPKDFMPDTVFIGGGTPTALSAAEYGSLLDSVQRRIDLSRVVEFSSEANPGTLTHDKLQVMKAGGINRVSIGVQTFNKKALRLLGRIHSADQAVVGYEMLRAAGFENVNIDLIQSVPGMSTEDILEDARRVVGLGPEHVSFYNLIYEPGTPMARDRDEGRITPPGDDEEADNYFAVKAVLEEGGYRHYEISNFCRTGRECMHNVLYWQGGEYFGCGPSAHSHWNGRRFGNLPDLRIYCDRMEGQLKPFDEAEELSSDDKARETMVMWMRMLDGVEVAKFEQQTGCSVHSLCGDSLRFLEKEGLIRCEGDRIRLDPSALFVCNSVFSELV